MENNSNNQEVKNKISWFGKIKVAVYILIGIAILMVALFYGFDKFRQWKGERGVENLKKSLEKIEEEDYKLAMADTYGGKTPQETLEMFITAVEKGDYELASKYFVIPEQEEWREGLSRTKEANKIVFFLEKIKEVKHNMQNGRYSEERDWFRVEKPVSIEFMKYPSGNWKIIKI